MHCFDHPVVTAAASATIGVNPDATIVVGVSGGADSVALTRALRIALRGSDAALVIAHLDHGLRPESRQDADWIAEFGKALDLPVVSERCDVARFAAENARGLEEAARQCRYAFLSRVARQQGVPDVTGALIAVGHTADDQAETILHHLLRGTGLRGLRGMPSSRPLDGATLIRPLLQVSRADLLSFLDDLEQPFLTDETNADERLTRNRIRHLLLPLLREQFNPRVAEALARLGEQASASQQIVEQLAAQQLAAAVEVQETNRIVVRVESLRTTSRHLVREAFRILFAQQNWPRQRMGFDDWDRLADLAQTSQAPKSLTLPDGLTAHFRQGRMTIEQGEPPPSPAYGA